MDESIGSSHPHVRGFEATEAGDEDKYIVFRLGQERYGAKLLEVREVVESMPIKAVPNTVRAFQGVCNLRGQVVGVVDLRTRFAIKGAPAPRPVLFVFETDSGAIAAAVDQIESVAVIPAKDIETKINIVTSVPAKYILGIGKLGDHMITIVALRHILSHEELTDAQASKLKLKAS